jgi:hypothetical protein
MDSPIGNSLLKKKIHSQHKNEVKKERPETSCGKRKPVEKPCKEEMYTATFLGRAANNTVGIDNS